MIDFACRKFSLDEVIKCGLGLTQAEFKVFRFFMMNSKKSLQSAEVERGTELDLSTVQRSVKKLYEKGVISRQQMNLVGGGYLYTYRIKPREEIKKVVMGIVDNWSQRVENEFEKW